VEDKVIVRRRGCKSPAIYDKGEFSKVFEAAMFDERGDDNATGVKARIVEAFVVHHIKMKFRVLKVGDIEILVDCVNGQQVERPFLKQYFDRRNVRRYTGQVPFGSFFVTVEYEVTPTRAHLYIYPPPMVLTKAEVGQYMDRAKANSEVIANKISRLGKWEFGIAEETDWIAHIAHADDSLVGIADSVSISTEGGDAWTSYSGGVLEYETSIVAQALEQIALPRDMIKVKTEVAAMKKDIIDLAAMKMDMEDIKQKLHFLVDRISTQAVGEKERSSLTNGETDRDDDCHFDWMMFR
jgi:hypothetical protein